jgi:hypothetical protein
MLNTTLTVPQITFLQPPPAGSQSEQILNESLENVLTMVSSKINNPGTNQPAVADSFARVADPWTVNKKLTQVFPVNNPPTP